MENFNTENYKLELEKRAYSAWNISPKLVEEALHVEKDLATSFSRIESNKIFNQLKVLKAMQKYKFAETDFAATTGYGYNDSGREKIEKIYAEVFGAEKALVRLSISAGTQAIAVALYACLRPGDEMLAAFGKPYDTLDSVIGIGDDSAADAGSLKDFGVSYRQVELTAVSYTHLTLPTICSV